MPQPANDNRPAEFDALLVKYLPALRTLAYRLRRSFNEEDREDLVQRTLVSALQNWRSYRPGATPWPWLTFIMRGIVSKDAIKARKEREYGETHGFRGEPNAVLPNQEHAAELSLLMNQIDPAIRAEFLAIGMGETNASVAAARGVTKQRVDQLVKAERGRLAGLERRADTRRALGREAA